MRRSARLVLAFALLAVSAPAYPAAAAPPALAGTTVVSGSTTAGMRVRLHRTVSVPVGTRTFATVSGPGRVVGVVLTRVDLDVPERPTIGYARWGFCDKAACRAGSSVEGLFAFGGVNSEGTALTLTRGEYQLYVVADGAPAQVVLRLPGLKGTTRLRPNVRNRFGPRTPTQRLDAGPTGNAYAVGDTHTFRGFGGISMQMVSLEAGPWVAGQVGDCLYDARPVDATAYQPGCPGGGHSRIADAVVSTFPIERQYVFPGYMRTNAGVLGHGAWYTAAAEVRSAHVPSFQLELDTIR